MGLDPNYPFAYIDDDDIADNSIQEFISALIRFDIAKDDKSKKPNKWTSTEGGIWLEQLLKEIPKPFTIIYEENYVDKDYRDSYYLYFSSQHFDLSRFCIRIAFFQEHLTPDCFFNSDNISRIEENYIGCCVIRPLKNHEIGKTLLDPQKYKNRQNISWYAKLGEYTTTIYGNKLKINAFPFSTQDQETTRCSDITILNLLDYFSQRYADYHRVFPSGIVDFLQQNGFERVLPARSMSFFNLTRILANCGFHPRHYTRENLRTLGDEIHLSQLLYYYVESGVPVAIGIFPKSEDCSDDSKKLGHSVLCIGHTNRDIQSAYEDIKSKKVGKMKFIDSAELHSCFIIMDDERHPYSEAQISDDYFKSIKENENAEPYVLDNITVPLYRRMYMDAIDAEAIFDKLLNDNELGIEKILGDDTPNLIIKRMYLTAGSNYKSYKLKHLGKTETDYKGKIISLSLPHFIWVCELFEEKEYFSDESSIFGELILDSTSDSSKGLESLIFLRYRKFFAYRTPEGSFDEFAELISKRNYANSVPEKQKPYCHNLKDISKKEIFV
jgi:hypothetical protein